tara:strand:+ start:4367 stop:4807 length:441 start_codon:yes stop_codon:yes gene_type:complete
MQNDPSAYLALPPPISTNALFNNRSYGKGRGRIITPEYRLWKSNAAQYLSVQVPLPVFMGRVEIVLYVGEKGAANLDIDNTSKAAIDALVTAKIIPNDSRKWLRSAAPEWVRGFTGIIAQITPVSGNVDRSDLVNWLPKAARGLVF